jgi:hypothetical protein
MSMSEPNYQADTPTNPTDVLILAGSGPEPHFDAVTRDFLHACHADLKLATGSGGLLEVAALGRCNPWLYRLVFRTRGLVRVGNGEIRTVSKHVVALRFLPDYLRSANRFAMLRLAEPAMPFHPNIAPGGVGAICVEIYPGEPAIEICQSLHDLFRWRLRQYDERDALNPVACAWGRDHVDRPIDDRPLFGRGLRLDWGPAVRVGG